MALKILHTGDWHIGSYPGPETNGENARYHDVLRCLNCLVETAAQESRASSSSPATSSIRPVFGLTEGSRKAAQPSRLSAASRR